MIMIFQRRMKNRSEFFSLKWFFSRLFDLFDSRDIFILVDYSDLWSSVGQVSVNTSSKRKMWIIYS